jgi:hypothetical protein
MKGSSSRHNKPLVSDSHRRGAGARGTAAASAHQSRPMKHVLTFFVLLASTACATSASAPSGRSPDDPMFQFSGTWEAALDGHGGRHFVDGSGQSISFRIIIETQSSRTGYAP